MDQLVCNKVGHEGHAIAGVCTFQQCMEKRTCCALCILNNHKTHVEQILALPELQHQYQGETYIYEMMKKIRKDVNDILDDIEKSLLKIVPIYPKEVNLSNLNKFGSQIAYQSNYIKGGNSRKFEHSVLVMKGTLNQIQEKIEQENQKTLDFRKKAAEKFKEQGYMFSCERNFEEALLYYNKALEAYDQDSSCWCSKGVVLAEMNEFEQAIECYKQAIEIEGTDPSYYSNMAYNLIILGRFEEAQDALKISLQIDGDHSASWNAKGLVLFKLNKKLEALECYKKAIQTDPDAAKYYNLANTLELLGRYEEAIYYYLEAVNLDQENEESIEGLNRLKEMGYQ